MKKSLKRKSQKRGAARAAAAPIQQPGKGLDVGTAFIYAAQKAGNEVVFRVERDAFMEIPYSDHLKTIFERDNVQYIEKDDQLYAIGNGALRFANLFQRSVRRPMERGVMSPKEKEALPIIKLIIENVLGRPRRSGEILYYSIPATPIDADFDVLYHQRIISGFISGLGYTPKPIHEGLAVVYAELAEENFTGLGISFGGGMTNACLANLSVPVVTFSIARGGDWIDEQVARVINQPVSAVTAWKEAHLDLDKTENLSRIEQALSIYYDALLDYVIGHLKQELGESAVHLEKPLMVVAAGGTAKPNGFLKKFQATLTRAQLPFKVEKVSLAPQLLHSVSKGALIAAIADETKKNNPVYDAKRR